MKPRSEKLKRLVAVQRRLEQLAEIDLAETNRQRGELEDAIAGVVDAMNAMTPVHRVFSQSYAARLGGLGGKARRLDNLALTQERKVLAEHAKAERLSERRADALIDEDRLADEEAVYDLLEILKRRGDSSLP